MFLPRVLVLDLLAQKIASLVIVLFFFMTVELCQQSCFTTIVVECPGRYNHILTHRAHPRYTYAWYILLHVYTYIHV